MGTRPSVVVAMSPARGVGSGAVRAAGCCSYWRMGAVPSPGGGVLFKSKKSTAPAGGY
jgi:hypothetical protein